MLKEPGIALSHVWLSISVNLCCASGQPDLQLFRCLILYVHTPFLPNPAGLCLCSSLTWNILSTFEGPGAALGTRNRRLNSLGPCLPPRHLLVRSQRCFQPVSDTTSSLCVVLRPAASAFPGPLWEIQSLRPQPRPLESESALY